MTEKYSGCNIVESRVTPKPAVPSKPKERSSRRIIGFFVRLAVAGALIGGLFALHYLQLPFLNGVRTALERVFCYDVFGRTAFGTSAFFG